MERHSQCLIRNKRKILHHVLSLFFFSIKSPLAFLLLSGLVLASEGQNWQKSSCILKILFYGCAAYLLVNTFKAWIVQFLGLGLRLDLQWFVSHSYLCLWAQPEAAGNKHCSLRGIFSVFCLHIMVDNAVCASNSMGLGFFLVLGLAHGFPWLCEGNQLSSSITCREPLGRSSVSSASEAILC